MSHVDLNASYDGDLILTGDLIGSAHDEAILQKAFEYLTVEYTHIYVDASAMRIIPSGYGLWLEIVHSPMLKNIAIEYADSQLADIIRYDDDYFHKKTVLPKE